jgi:Tfp pilus assembly pilus retraction ATPase PilT
MTQSRRNSTLPKEVISLTTYAQLDLYLAKFSAGELGLVLLLGRHGTGKSESVKRALRIPMSA